MRPELPDPTPQLSAFYTARSESLHGIALPKPVALPRSEAVSVTPGSGKAFLNERKAGES